MNNKDLLRFEILNGENSLLISKWGVHSNPLFFDYNIRIKNKRDAILFVHSKQFPPFRKYYAIFYNNSMEGMIGIKKINYFVKSSELGLVLNPSIVSKGLGSLALSEFLNIYFNRENMKKMTLDVANYNLRARKLYEKMGFKRINIYEDLYPNKDLDFSNPYLYDKRKYFSKKWGRWYYKAISMELKKDDFNAIFYRTK